MVAHKIQQGICIQCGCDKYAIEYFGWSCSGRSIQHIYKNDTCINCGFVKKAIAYFDWPCRLDYRRARIEEDSYQSRDHYRQDWKSGDRRDKKPVQSWQHPNDEMRYGQLLGLKGKVTKWDIKRAYRELAYLYHPDRVAHLAPDIQDLATEKMKEINLAFAYFENKYGV